MFFTISSAIQTSFKTDMNGMIQAELASYQPIMETLEADFLVCKDDVTAAQGVCETCAKQKCDQ